MMKPRSSRGGGGAGGGGGGGGGGGSSGDRGEMSSSSSTNRQTKLDSSGGANGSAASQQAAAAAAAAQARKRRSSINVYDQPSSLNSRLRQLETDMLRLDEDRTKLFDDTHSALAQYELKLGEIHAILKSRQDNVEKYVGDMKVLLTAKEEFEKQTKVLNEKHDRIHEKFMHRETIISREIKLLKNKFEILEKNRQFRNMLQKSLPGANDMQNGTRGDDLSSGLEGSSEFERSETTTIRTSMSQADLDGGGGGGGGGGGTAAADQQQLASASSNKKNVRIRLSKFASIGQLLAPLLGGGRAGNSKKRRRRRSLAPSTVRKSNKISAAAAINSQEAATVGQQQQPANEQVDDNTVAISGVEAPPITADELLTVASNAQVGGAIKKSSTFLSRLFARK